MQSVGQRKCRHCHQPFSPDARRRERQRYCVAPECRRASKVASQRQWLQRPENRDYFRGPENVQRVQAWRAANPGYGKRRGRKQDALQDMMKAQTPEPQAPTAQDGEVPLQETWRSQHPLVVGLIAQLTGAALQEDMAAVMRRLIARGQALLEPNRKNHDRKTPPLSGTCATHPAAL
jgi:hypothetical protein